MLSYNEILDIAMEQSAMDVGCKTSDLKENRRTVVLSQINNNRKRYYKGNLFCDLIYYGAGLVCSVEETLKPFMDDYVNHYEESYRYFDAPNLIYLNQELMKHGHCICHIAEYFLFDPSKKVEINENITYKLLKGKELEELYSFNGFDMALKYDCTSTFRDEIAVVAYINGCMAGVAGCSNDSDTMWQIGVDVLPEFRRQGVASTLTNILAQEVIKQGKVPFYCIAYSNIPSKLNAFKAGFKTAWIEMTAKPIKYAFNMINEKYE